jgi:hypothetical protein
VAGTLQTEFHRFRSNRFDMQSIGRNADAPDAELKPIMYSGADHGPGT